jgi:hypothetical protein
MESPDPKKPSKVLLFTFISIGLLLALYLFGNLLRQTRQDVRDQPAGPQTLMR